MSKSATRRHYIDPGHSWIRVPMKEIAKLGIQNNLTSESHMKGEFAYLECDLDAGVYRKAMEDAGITLKLVDITRVRSANLRKYPQYCNSAFEGVESEIEQPRRQARSKVQSSGGDAKPKTSPKKRVPKTQKTTGVVKTGDFMQTGDRFAKAKIKKSKISEGDLVSLVDDGERRTGKVVTILSEQIVCLMDDTECVAFFFQKGLDIKKVEA